MIAGEPTQQISPRLPFSVRLIPNSTVGQRSCIYQYGLCTECFDRVSSIFRFERHALSRHRRQQGNP